MTPKMHEDIMFLIFFLFEGLIWMHLVLLSEWTFDRKGIKTDFR